VDVEQQVGKSRSGVIIGVLAGVVVVLVAVIVAMVLLADSSEDDEVTLLPAADAGADPFTESVQSGETDIAAPAAAAAADVRAELPRDDSTALLVANGTEPGLYGGSGDERVCDAAKLVEFLNDNADKAAAWSDVLGITPDGIGDYAASLTPVVLVSDTLVTNHGFADGEATVVRSVLQAGTAVMVDDQGVPRVKCNCGNPLTPPEPVAADDWQLQGQLWTGFDVTQVTTIRAGDSVTEFTLCDLQTGRRFTRPVGSTGGSGTAPPNIDGEWTISLRQGATLTQPLPPGSIDTRRCPIAGFEGAVLAVQGTRASIDDVPGLGPLVGTVEGAPPDSPAWLGAVQTAVNGAVIRLRAADGSGPELRLVVATAPTQLAGSLSVIDANGQPGDCNVGVVATKGGAAPASSTTTSSSTTSSSTTSTVASAGAGGPCDPASLEAVVESMVGEPIVALDVVACDGKWAAVGYGRGGQDDAGLLEWTGAAWQGGVCQQYRDPDDWTKSPVVPDQFWIACIVD
jgi:hypothetical protein